MNDQQIEEVLALVDAYGDQCWCRGNGDSDTWCGGAFSAVEKKLRAMLASMQHALKLAALWDTPHDPDPDKYGDNPCRRCGMGANVDWSVSGPQDEHGNFLPCIKERPL